MIAYLPSRIKDDLTGIITGLYNLGICSDQNFPIIRGEHEEWAEVTFNGAENISIAMKDIEYTEIYRELMESRSYSMKLIDGALLQLMYTFEGSRLVKQRLAFYPSPNLLSFQDDPDSYMDDELFVEIVERRIVPFPLRFDFDDRDGSHKEITHPRCHLTLGDVKDCRISVTAPLTPRWFVEFVLRNFYETEKHSFVEQLPEHKVHFEETITSDERGMIHLRVPRVTDLCVLLKT